MDTITMQKIKAISDKLEKRPSLCCEINKCTIETIKELMCNEWLPIQVQDCKKNIIYFEASELEMDQLQKSVEVAKTQGATKINICFAVNPYICHMVEYDVETNSLELVEFYDQKTNIPISEIETILA